MLGHKLWRAFSTKTDIYATLHKTISAYTTCGLFDSSRSYENVDAQNQDRISSSLRCATVPSHIQLHRDYQAAAGRQRSPGEYFRECAVSAPVGGALRSTKYPPDS